MISLQTLIGAMTIAAMLIAAGMWAGAIQSDVNDLKRYHDSEHGSYVLSKGTQE